MTFESITNTTVLLRADLNEPLVETESPAGAENIASKTLASTRRIDASIETIQELLSRKNNVIVVSHLSDSNESLLPMVNYIRKAFTDRELVFVQSLDREEIQKQVQDAINESKQSSKKALIIMENLRSFPNEVEEKGDSTFAEFLAGLAETFVYDAFSVAHRRHASVIGVAPLIPHTLGPVATRELNSLKKILQPEVPELVILGGAKLSTKLPLVQKFLDTGAEVFLGGAMAHPLLAKRGADIKNSLTENEIELSEESAANTNLITPIDHIWNQQNNKIVDIGPKSVELLKEKIQNAKTILWNGPLGLYEGGFTDGTVGLIQLLDMNHNKENEKKFIVVGGGDTLTVLEHFPDFTCSYVSLSGGAMLDFLAKGTLPGIEANS